MKYRAFVSYSGSGYDLASRLHRELEKYSVPRPLRSRRVHGDEIGASLGRLFLDNAELSATATLKTDIEEALAQSRFLIVLCSPEAAASTWVPLEIEVFKAQGRGDFVLPILVAGEPRVYDPSTSPDGAFPVELLGPEIDLDGLPLAPDFRDALGAGDEAEAQYQTAFLRIVARFLDIPFPDLTQRQLVAERQRRRFRNRVIALLLGLLGLAIAGGATAWVQKTAADTRLAQAINSAARQVNIAASSRDRYGVPTSFAEEMYTGASEDFTEILDYSGSNPSLLLNRARYHLGMSDLSADRTGSILAGETHLEQALRDIEMGTRLRHRWYIGALHAALPDPAEFARVEIGALDRAARVALQAQNAEAAQDLAQQALALATQLSAETLSEDRVFGQCALADVAYRLSNRSEAETEYAACLAATEELVAATDTEEAKTLRIRALIDFGMVQRLNREDIAEASKLHDQAVALVEPMLAREKVSNDHLLLAFEALATRSDTRNLEGAPLEDVIADYEAAQTILESLIATDGTRLDWQVQSANLSYRLAGAYARQAIAAGNPTKLTTSLEALNDASTRVETPSLLMSEDVDIQRIVSAIAETRAELLLLRGRDGEDVVLAFDLMTEVIATRRDALAATGTDRRAARDLANAHLTRGRLFMDDPTRVTSVQTDFDAARAIFRDLSEDPEFLPNIYRDLSLTDYFDAQFRASRQKLTEACQLARSAETYAARHMEAVPGNPTIANEWGVTRQGVETLCPAKELPQ